MIRFFSSLWNIRRDLTLSAAALAFTTVLSLVPFLAVTLAVMGSVDALDKITPKVEALILHNFTGAAGTEGVELMKRGIQRIQNGRMGTWGALILILVATKMMLELDHAFQRIWRIQKTRPLVKRLFFYWLTLLLFPFLLAIWVKLTNFLTPELQKPLPFKPGAVLTFFFLFFLNRYLPSTRVRALAAFVGTSFSVVLLVLLESGFRHFSIEILKYGKVYGSFAAIPAFLFWIYLVWLVVLWGVALVASMQKEL